MRSLDFEEFLNAKDYSTQIDSLLTHMLDGQPFSDLEMNVFSNLFLDYSILGGMPAVVRNYLQKGTFEGSLQTQRAIIGDYREDMRKYAEGLDQVRITHVFDSVVPQLGKQTGGSRFQKLPKAPALKTTPPALTGYVTQGSSTDAIV